MVWISIGDCIIVVLYVPVFFRILLPDAFGFGFKDCLINSDGIGFYLKLSLAFGMAIELVHWLCISVAKRIADAVAYRFHIFFKFPVVQWQRIV